MKWNEVDKNQPTTKGHLIYFRLSIVSIVKESIEFFRPATSMSYEFNKQFLTNSKKTFQIKRMRRVSADADDEEDETKSVCCARLCVVRSLCSSWTSSTDHSPSVGYSTLTLTLTEQWIAATSLFHSIFPSRFWVRIWRLSRWGASMWKSFSRESS